MDPLIIILGILFLAAAAAAAVFYGNAQKEQKAAAQAQEEKATLESRVKTLDDEIASLKARPKSKPEPVKAEPKAAPKVETRVEVRENKEAQRELQKQIHALKEEVKALREKLQGRKSEESDFDPIQMRAELMEARNLAEEHRHRADQALKEVARLQDALADGAPAPVAAAPAPTAGADEEQLSALKDAHKAELREASDRLRGELKELKERSRAEVRQARDQAGEELKDLRGKLRKAQRDAEQQRRRAENTNKAYRILQLQLDASLEKLALLDPSVAAPGGFYDPEVEAALKQKAAAARREREAAAAQQREARQQQAAAAALAQAMNEQAPAADEAPAVEIPEISPALPVVEGVPQLPGNISLDLSDDLVDAGWSLSDDDEDPLGIAPPADT